MARRYTAEEFREMAIEAEVIEVADQFDGHNMDTIAAMLRQAAEVIEREKRWEYAVMYTALNGCRCISPGRAHCIAATKNILSLYNDRENANIVRREVGEWEEVK